jgi:hypothetical protein
MYIPFSGIHVAPVTIYLVVMYIPFSGIHVAPVTIYLVVMYIPFSGIHVAPVTIYLLDFWKCCDSVILFVFFTTGTFLKTVVKLYEIENEKRLLVRLPKGQ